MTERYIIINHATPKKDVVTLLEKFATILGITEPSDRYEFIGESLRYDIPFFTQSDIEYVDGDVAFYEHRECYGIDIDKGVYIGGQWGRSEPDLIKGDRVVIIDASLEPSGRTDPRNIAFNEVLSKIGVTDLTLLTEEQKISISMEVNGWDRETAIAKLAEHNEAMAKNKANAIAYFNKK